MADIFDFNYILISNFNIKDSELSNTYDFSSMISLEFPCLFAEKYHSYILNYFEKNNIMNPDYITNNTINNNNKIDIYNHAGFHYIENFANLNNHIFYLGELNENYRQKTTSLIEDFENLKFEENEKIESSENNNNNSLAKIKSKNKFSFKENLDKFLCSQISNHMIHFVDHRENLYKKNEKHFSEMDLFEQENCININNSKMKIQGMGNFDGVQMENPNWNFNENLNIKMNNFSQNNSLINMNMNMNNSTNFLNSTGENLSEFLSDCQKLILLSGFIASELPQKLDTVIFKPVKKSNISTKVNYFSYFFNFF